MSALTCRVLFCIVSVVCAHTKQLVQREVSVEANGQFSINNEVDNQEHRDEPRRIVRSAKVPAESEKAPQRRVAVVGSGPSGNSAVYFLKKEHGADFNVTMFEVDAEIGGVMTSTQYGSESDWNRGQADSGMVVAFRFGYPNYFNFLDTEGIQTERRPMTLQVGNDQPVNKHGDHSMSAFIEFYTDLVKFQGTFEEFARTSKNSTNPATKWFCNENELMTQAHMQFMTLDFGTQTSHAADVLMYLNMTGDAHYDAPVGGYGRSARKAAEYADQLRMRARVTEVRPQSPVGPVEISWKVGTEDHHETFDDVILTVPPNQLRQIIRAPLKMAANLALLPDSSSEWESFITLHNHSAILGNSSDVAFYNFVQEDGLSPDETLDMVNVFPNGKNPPYVSFLPGSCDEECRRKYIPADAVLTEYQHWNFAHTGEPDRTRSARFLNEMSGWGGMHYAGVWTADGRFVEGTWVSGMRAAMEVAKVDPASYSFTSSCSARSFHRFGLWFKRNKTEDAAVGPIHPSCFLASGQVPPYFKSQEEYELLHETLHSRIVSREM